MKQKPLQITVTLLIMMISCLPMLSASNHSYRITMYPTYEAPYDPVENEDPDKGHRLPMRPMNCVITAELGIEFESGNESEIHTYEILDSSGCPIAEFNDESDFVSYFFTLSGTYHLRFTTDSVIYTGSVSL